LKFVKQFQNNKGTSSNSIKSNKKIGCWARIKCIWSLRYRNGTFWVYAFSFFDSLLSKKACSPLIYDEIRLTKIKLQFSRKNMFIVWFISSKEIISEMILAVFQMQIDLKRKSNTCLQVKEDFKKEKTVSTWDWTGVISSDWLNPYH
jgi:hypothetical protein